MITTAHPLGNRLAVFFQATFESEEDSTSGGPNSGVTKRGRGDSLAFDSVENRPRGVW